MQISLFTHISLYYVDIICYIIYILPIFSCFQSNGLSSPGLMYIYLYSYLYILFVVLNLARRYTYPVCKNRLLPKVCGKN